MIPAVRVSVAVATCLAWGALAAAAAAARAENPDPGAAEELIGRANELRRNGRDAPALPLYRKAYETARSARTAGQLGLAELSLGYWVAAEGHLDEALTETRNPSIEKNRSVLEGARRSARSHLAELRVDGTPGGAEVVVNGSVVGTLPLAGPLRVSEGRVVLEVRAPGWRTMTRTFPLAGQATERVQVSLERVVTASEGPPPTTRVERPTSGGALDGAREGNRPKGSDSAERP